MLFRERMVPALHVKSDQDQGTQRATRRAGATRCSRCCHRSPLRPASTANQQRGQDPRTACTQGQRVPVGRQAGRRRSWGGAAQRPAGGQQAGWSREAAARHAAQICGPHQGLAGHSPGLAPERAGSGASARGAGRDGSSAAQAVLAVRQRPAHSAQRPARAAARQACRGRTEA